MLLHGRISTILRTLRASTPVESLRDVVRMVGMVFCRYLPAIDVAFDTQWRESRAADAVGEVRQMMGIDRQHVLRLALYSSDAALTSS